MPSRPRSLSALAALSALLVVTLLAPDAAAYRRFTDGCNDCHRFRTNPYPSPKGETWPTSLHEVHRNNAYMATDCDACHNAADFANPRLAYSDLTTAGTAPGLGCLGCHGTPDGTGTPRGWGLRRHHENHGVDCWSCHDTDGTPPPENVFPVGYAQPLTNADNPCLDPALPGTEDWSGNGIGLDNDGDDLYDLNDPDCATVPTCIDRDGDGYGDPASADCPAGLVADCNDADAGAWLPPDEVALLLWTSRFDLSWDDLSAQAGPGTRYDVLSGRLAELPVGAGANEGCLGTMDTTFMTDTTPEAGIAEWYLVRGTNSCPSSPGSYGRDFFGTERRSTACP